MTSIDITITVRLETDLPASTETGYAYGEAAAASLGGRLLDAMAMPSRPAPKRIAIRSHSYRGTDGFSVQASSGESIFTVSRASAERIRDRLRAGETTRREDFDL